MVTVTDNAYSRLKHKLQRQPSGTAMRITVHESQIRFRPDTEQTGDTVFAQEGRSLLLLGQSTAARVIGCTLDVVETQTGGRLRFVRNA